MFERTDLESLIGHLPIAIYVCEAPSGVIRFYNRRAAELWGREPALGSTDERFCGSLRLFRPDGRPLAHADTPMAEVLRHGGHRDEEVIIERPDGTRITVRVNIAELHDADGRRVGAVNAFQDITAQKLREEAARLSEARYRAIVEDHPEMICRLLPDGTITFANEAYCEFFGWSRDEIVGRTYRSRVHPEDRAHVDAQVGQLGPANRVVVVENRVVRDDGSVRWTEWTNHAVYDGDHLLEVQASGRDVTERRQAEEAAARLAAIVASAEDAIIGKTLDGVITSWNRAAERMLGYSAAEAIGRSVTIVVPRERLEEEADILARLRRAEIIESFETERVTRDGRRLPVSLTISPVRDGLGRIIGASTIARDITDRRRADARLRDTVQTLETLYRLADRVGRATGLDEVCEAAVEAIMAVGADRASVLLLDDHGVMRFKAWSNLSERYRAAVEGHSPWSRDSGAPDPIVVADVLADPSMAALREVVVEEGIRALGFVPLVERGRLLGKFMIYYDAPHAVSPAELRLAATIAHHVASGVARVQATAAIENLLARERSARQEADAARRAAEGASRAKDEFLAMLAHELRNPLSVIVNAIAVVHREASLASNARRAAAAVRRQAEHLAHLLDDLLDVARITSGRIKLELEAIDLRTSVEQGVEGQRHGIDAKRQHLLLSLPDTPFTVMGDSVRLQQIVGNLVNNAVKYTPAGGTIEIILARADGEALLSVRDDGAGIPPEHLESIFDLFAQANPTLAHAEGGLGIGLTLVRRLVDLHGGSVRALSEGLGRGAEFVVRLPLAEAAPVSAPVAPVHAVRPRRRILIVEDHEDGREMLALTLRLQGYEVLEAASGQAGLELATDQAPDVALVDIGLPDIQGYEVGRTLRQLHGPGLRLVALTGYGQPKDRARSEEAGFDAHLVKPVDPFALVQMLDRLEAPTEVS